MAQCNLGDTVATIGAGRDSLDSGKAPGELSLAALVSSAKLDPARSIREYRAEAMIALQARAAVDVFSERRLRARAVRYVRAAALVEASCLACVTPCSVAPVAVGPGYRDRMVAPDRLARWRAGGRRLEDWLGDHVPQFA